MENPLELDLAVTVLAGCRHRGQLPYQRILRKFPGVLVRIGNGIVHIADSKTVNGIGDMPMASGARDAFRRQIEEVPGSAYLFPSPKRTASKPQITNRRKAWAVTLKKAGVPYFAPYEMRHTFATRLSAGGVADHMVTQMLRQGDAEVFKLYSQAKLGYDARGTRQTGSSGERAAREFVHGEAQLTDFFQILRAVTSNREHPNGGMLQ